MAGPNNRAYATAQTQIGLAIETTIGTAPAQPTYMFPVKSPKYEPNQIYLPDETLQGSMVAVYDLVQGMRYDTHGWEAPPYLASFPILLRGLLGSSDNLVTKPTNTTLSSPTTVGSSTVVVAASVAANDWINIGSGASQETHMVTAVVGTGPYTLTLNTPVINVINSGATVSGLTGHQFSLLNNSAVGEQPPSISIWDGDGEEWRLLTAGQVDQLTIKGNGTGLTSYSVTWFANPAQTSVSAPMTSYVGQQTPAPWTFFGQFEGSALPTITEWEFDFKRGVTPIPGLTGTVEYLEYFAGPLQCTGKLTLVEQSGSPYLADYLSGARGVLDCTLFDLLHGAALNLHCSEAQFNKASLDRSKPYVQVPVEFQMLPSTTDALAGGVSPVLATVANANATSY